MNRVAISVEGGAANSAMLILLVVWMLGGLCAANYRLGKGVVGIGHFQRDIADTVAVFSYVLGGHIVRGQRRCEHKIRLTLTHRVRSALTMTGFKPAVGDLREAESFAIEIGCLPRIADPKFDVMNAF